MKCTISTLILIIMLSIPGFALADDPVVPQIELKQYGPDVKIVLKVAEENIEDRQQWTPSDSPGDTRVH